MAAGVTLQIVRDWALLLNDGSLDDPKKPSGAEPCLDQAR